VATDATEVNQRRRLQAEFGWHRGKAALFYQRTCVGAHWQDRTHWHSQGAFDSESRD
jgi:hypothetical protein